MIVLYCLFALIAVLATTLLLNTAIKTAKAHKLEGDHPTFSQEELEEYATALQQMIACKTVSVKDSYDDTEFAKLRQVVRERFPLLHERRS
jgi:hypothetical protein